MVNISVVIPTYDKYELLHNILYDIYQYNKDVTEVVVVNNGSKSDETSKGLKWWETTKMLPIKVITLSENIGFLKACNLGVSESKGDIVILVSNDVSIKRNIVPDVLSLLEDKNFVGGRLLDWGTGWNNFGDKVFPYLEGWLLCFTRRMWDDVGGFDERFAPYDMEDVDISTSAIAKGYSLVQLDVAGITHLGAQTIGFNPEREAITIQHKEIFRKKWVDNEL
jgi:GT2 family glycosyltransferase